MQFGVFVLLLSINGILAPLQVQGEARDIADRIELVESRLCPPIMVEGCEPVYRSIHDQMVSYAVPGVSIAVVNNGQIEWARAYGTRRADGDSPLDTSSLFRAGSISKAIAAVAALRLVDDGRLSLDKPINQFLSSWKIPATPLTEKKPVTLKWLLCHGAGVNNHTLGEYYPGEELPTMLQMLDGLPPAKNQPVRVETEPGSEFSYSGGGYLILSQAMVDVVDRPFNRIVAETVLEPLGMKRSTYIADRKKAEIENVAIGHDHSGSVYEGLWPALPNLAGGGLWTTPSDLCRFVIEVQKSLNGQSDFMSPALAKQIMVPIIGGYGLGFILEGEGEEQTFGHGGNTGGYHALMVAFVRRGEGVVIMTNGDNGPSLFHELLSSVALAYDWKNLKPRLITPAQLSFDVLAERAGRYIFNEVLATTISVEGNHLKMVGDDGREFQWYPQSENLFYDLYSGWELSFVTNDSGQVTGAFLGVSEEMRLKGAKVD